MEITLSQPAVNWLINELDLTNGDYLRFFVRYGGHGGEQAGFSLGMTQNDLPVEPLTKTIIEGITFFIEKKDGWYFNQKNLHIKYSRKKDEIEFIIA
ncbi:HesB/YadR/YfhF family protein [Amphibacillus sediminis]|uniref:HesB/YadR/YfhF family protein n=1 Tax=Amphibacillus sediminis TaxID=360185 RepID=UPI00082F5E14|nr:HesB/YadR/YfhF family protein [Amphibacillus sediminis]